MSVRSLSDRLTLSSPAPALQRAAGITPTNTQFEAGDVRRYGADPTGSADSTLAFNRALAGNGTCSAVDGVYRIDGTVTIESYHSVRLSNNAKLIRKASATNNTAPVVHIRGVQSSMDGGAVWPENSSPSGVVYCGATDVNTRNWQSVYWEFKNCFVYCKDFGRSQREPVSRRYGRRRRLHRLFASRCSIPHT